MVLFWTFCLSPYPFVDVCDFRTLSYFNLERIGVISQNASLILCANFHMHFLFPWVPVFYDHFNV